jgi:hypothetical protein
VSDPVKITDIKCNQFATLEVIEYIEFKENNSTNHITGVFKRSADNSIRFNVLFLSFLVVRVPSLFVKNELVNTKISCLYS